MRIERYNGIPAIEILGETPSGSGSGAAMNAVEEIAATLPDGVDWGWTGISFQEMIFSHGAGAGAQHSLGIVIVDGMLTTSLLVPY